MCSHKIVSEEKNDDGSAKGDYVSRVSGPASIPDAVERISNGYAYECAEERTDDDFRIRSS
jgi:hypothetical protein